MRTLTKYTLSVCIGLALGIGQAVAGAKPDQIHRLSEDLTPMGSERAGNADGTPATTTRHRGRKTNRCSVSPAQITSSTGIS